MRIGNLDDSEKSDSLIKLIQSESSENLTGSKKWKNWWHYYKWYVICGIILIGIACNIIGNAFGLWRKSPDFQFAYIGETELPPDTAAAMEEAFSKSLAGLNFPSSSSGMDFNGDGEITIKLNQYIDSVQTADIDSAYLEYASELTLIGDISNCDSYFFLMDDPESFQREFQLLAASDGGCPDETDYSIDGKVILWSDCPALSGIADIVEAKAPGSLTFLSGLYIGRRCFPTDAVSDNADKCSELWEFLISSQ